MSVIHKIPSRAERLMASSDSINASIEAKIERAVAELAAQGKDPSKMTEAEIEAMVKSIDWSRDEMDVAGITRLEGIAAVVIGEKAIAIINQHMKIEPAELRKCLTAYFAALDAGELEPVDIPSLTTHRDTLKDQVEATSELLSIVSDMPEDMALVDALRVKADQGDEKAIAALEDFERSQS